MILAIEEMFMVGKDSFFESVSPVNSFGVTFEDDLTTGYFYAVNTEPDLQILDALHIYDVENITGKSKPGTIKIYWSDDGLIASLLINNYCHAIFDFKNKAGYCRNGFPAANRNWVEVQSRNLTDELIENIFKEK